MSFFEDFKKESLAGRESVESFELAGLVANVRRFKPQWPWGTLRVSGVVLAVNGVMTDAGLQVADAFALGGDK